MRSWTGGAAVRVVAASSRPAGGDGGATPGRVEGPAAARRTWCEGMPSSWRSLRTAAATAPGALPSATSCGLSTSLGV